MQAVNKLRSVSYVRNWEKAKQASDWKTTQPSKRRVKQRHGTAVFSNISEAARHASFAGKRKLQTFKSITDMHIVRGGKQRNGKKRKCYRMQVRCVRRRICAVRT